MDKKKLSKSLYATARPASDQTGAEPQGDVGRARSGPGREENAAPEATPALAPRRKAIGFDDAPRILGVRPALLWAGAIAVCALILVALSMSGSGPGKPTVGRRPAASPPPSGQAFHADDPAAPAPAPAIEWTPVPGVKYPEGFKPMRPRIPTGLGGRLATGPDGKRPASEETGSGARNGVGLAAVKTGQNRSIVTTDQEAREILKGRRPVP